MVEYIPDDSYKPEKYEKSNLEILRENFINNKCLKTAVPYARELSDQIYIAEKKW